MGRNGQKLLSDNSRVLTHCNAGALATGGYGTALGVVRAAVEAGKRIEVIADETRPFLQGARLTAWELLEAGIPVTVITDNAAGYFMGRGQVDAVIVGADRIAANGDVANKIGTYSLAVLARHHGARVMVVAPHSTVDPRTADGGAIPIEERSADEIWAISGRPEGLPGALARNPVFDVTPADLIDVIVTDRGVAQHPDSKKISGLLGDGAESSVKASR